MTFTRDAHTHSHMYIYKHTIMHVLSLSFPLFPSASVSLFLTLTSCFQHSAHWETRLLSERLDSTRLDSTLSWLYLGNAVLLAFRRVCHKTWLRFREGFGLRFGGTRRRRLGSRGCLPGLVVNARYRSCCCCCCCRRSRSCGRCRWCCCCCQVLLVAFLAIRGRSLYYILHLYSPDKSYD